MSVDLILEYLESHSSGACLVVDLFSAFGTQKLAENVEKKREPAQIVVDVEHALPMLYGGVKQEWFYGGEWGKMFSLLRALQVSCVARSIELVLVFDGSNEPDELKRYFRRELERAERTRQLGELITSNSQSNVSTGSFGGSTSPFGSTASDAESYKRIWQPPAALRYALRTALRILNMTILQSGAPQNGLADSHHETALLRACVAQHAAALASNNANVLVLAGGSSAASSSLPLRLISAKKLRLKASGQLRTVEYDVGAFQKQFAINSDQLLVLGALLSASDAGSLEIEAVGALFRGLYERERAPEGTSTSSDSSNKSDSTDSNSKTGNQTDTEKVIAKLLADARLSVPLAANMIKRCRTFEEIRQSLTSAFLAGQSGSGERNEEALNAKANEIWKIFTSRVVVMKNARKILSAGIQPEGDAKSNANAASSPESEKSINAAAKTGSNQQDAAVNALETQLKELELRDSDGAASVVLVGGRRYSLPQRPFHEVPLRRVHAQVLSETTDRHRRGVMHEWCLHILRHGEVRVATSFEWPTLTGLPSAVQLYRRVRQHAYAVLLDVRADVATGCVANENFRVVEWYVTLTGGSGTPSKSASSKSGSGLVASPKVDLVKPLPVDWGAVQFPDVHSLWFGGSDVDAHRRLRAFLACFANDFDWPLSLLLNVHEIPPHLMVAGVVLRWLLSAMRVLRRFELDVLLATVCSPMLNNPDAIASLTVPPSRVDLRAVHLAALFLAGVEHVAFVNDACGAPIPPRDVAPWRIFDGRLFQAKYAASQRGVPLIELCDGNNQLMGAAEQLRAAVLEDLPRAQFVDDTPASATQPPGGASPLIGMPGATMFGSNEQPEARLLVGGTPVGRWTNQPGFPSQGPLVAGYPQHPPFGYPPNWYPHAGGAPPNWFNYPGAPPYAGFPPPHNAMPMGNWYRPPMQAPRKFLRMPANRGVKPYVKRNNDEQGKPASSNGETGHVEAASNDGTQHGDTHDGTQKQKDSAVTEGGESTQ